MRRSMFWALVVLLSLSAPGAWARAAWKPRLLVHGGLSVPTTPDRFSDGSSLGFGGGIGLGIRIAPPVVLMGNVDYTTFGLDEAGFKRVYGAPVGGALRGGEIATLYASIGLKFGAPPLPARPVRPYFFGGVGYFRFVPDDVTVDGNIVVFRTEDTAGIHGGGGLDVSMGPSLNLFFEVVFIAGFTDDDITGYLPLRAGLAIDLAPGR